jgi:hypothetical protein
MQVERDSTTSKIQVVFICIFQLVEFLSIHSFLVLLSLVGWHREFKFILLLLLILNIGGTTTVVLKVDLFGYSKTDWI